LIGKLAGTPPTVDESSQLHHLSGRMNLAGNRGFLMPWPRTLQQDGHLPICQQCHEDSREVGDLAADGSGTAAPFTGAYGDGLEWDDVSKTWVDAVGANPLFQNFPHETLNSRMLVEENDDLCLNCHPMAQLP
jgi:hypothetical protein